MSASGPSGPLVSIEPGLAVCFPRLFINKKVNIKIFNLSLA